MKSFSDFAKKTQVAEAKITKDKFYKNEVYKKGEWVLTEAGQVGKILRRGPNYVLCLTAEETTFRTWITNIKEVFEIGTDAYREYVMSLTPGQRVQKPEGTVAVKQVIPTDPKKDKMDHHEEKTLAQYGAEAITKNLKTEWRYDYSAKMANTDIKGKGADGVGGGDAPGMKLAEPKGEEGKPDIKKVKHSCVTKVEHPEWGAGNCLSGEHTLTEDGTVTHYDIMFEHGLEKSVPVESFEVVKEVVHEHTARPDQAQDEVNTELPAGPHGTTFVEPAIKSEGFPDDLKKKGDKDDKKDGKKDDKKKGNPFVKEGVGAVLKVAAKGAAKGAVKGAKAGAAKGAVSGAAGALKGKKESRSFKDFRSISEKKQ